MADERLELAIFRALGEAGCALPPNRVSALAELAVQAAGAIALEDATADCRQALDVLRAQMEDLKAEHEEALRGAGAQHAEELQELKGQLEQVRAEAKKQASASRAEQRKAKAAQQRAAEQVAVSKSHVEQALQQVPDLMSELFIAQQGRQALERLLQHAIDTGVREGKRQSAERLAELLWSGAFNGLFGMNGAHGPTLRLAQALQKEAESSQLPMPSEKGVVEEMWRQCRPGALVVATVEDVERTAATLSLPDGDLAEMDLRHAPPGVSDLAQVLQRGERVEVVVLDKYGDVPNGDDWSSGYLDAPEEEDPGPDEAWPKVLVSMQAAAERRGAEMLLQANRRRTIVRGTVSAVRKSGLDVMIGGATAFLPWEFAEPGLQEQGRGVYRKPIEAQVHSLDTRGYSATLTRQLWVDLSAEQPAESACATNATPDDPGEA